MTFEPYSSPTSGLKDKLVKLSEKEFTYKKRDSKSKKEIKVNRRYYLKLIDLMYYSTELNMNNKSIIDFVYLSKYSHLKKNEIKKNANGAFMMNVNVKRMCNMLFNKTQIPLVSESEV